MHEYSLLSLESLTYFCKLLIPGETPLLVIVLLRFPTYDTPSSTEQYFVAGSKTPIYLFEMIFKIAPLALRSHTLSDHTDHENARPLVKSCAPACSTAWPESLTNVSQHEFFELYRVGKIRRSMKRSKHNAASGGLDNHFCLWLVSVYLNKGISTNGGASGLPCEWILTCTPCQAYGHER